MKVPSALLGGAAFFLSGSMSQPDPSPVSIDLSRYMGTWRVIACTDNPVEKKFFDATETYAPSGTDRLDVTFKWRSESHTAPLQTHEFKGRITKHPSHAVWKMKLFPLMSATYIVVDVAPDYSWAVIAHPSKKFGWILARAKTVPDEVWGRALNKFAALGYDTSKFIKVPQEH